METIETEMWRIMVPYKIGRKNVPVPYHQEWDAKVLEISGGLTINRASQGRWVNGEGKLFKELMIPVDIACNKRQIEEIMTFTMSHYKQEAVMAFKMSSMTLVMYREEDNDNVETNN